MKAHRTIAVIGTGEIARLHAQAIQPLHWELAGGFDIDPRASQEFCRAFGGKVYESAQAVLADPRVDTVYVCTRHNSHTELAGAALRANKNVFLEKPLALDPKEAEELRRIYDCHPAAFAVGYNMRVAPAVRSYCALLRRFEVQVQSFKASMTGPPFMDGWASDAIQGGGVLVCQGSHMFDLIGYVLGSPVAAVCAQTWHQGLDKTREPNAAALLVRLVNGARGTLLMHDRGTPAFHADAEGRMVSLTAYSPQGTFEMDAYGKVRWGTQDGFFEMNPAKDAGQCVRWGYAAQAREFAQLMQTGKSCLCTMQQGQKIVDVVQAAKRSAGTGMWEPVLHREE